MNPRLRVHFVAMQKYTSRMGKIATIWKKIRWFTFLYLFEIVHGLTSRYMMTHPTNVMHRKVGEANLNTLGIYIAA